MHKTTASPLALLYIGLVVYASLYPFAEWRNQGIVPWAFLSAPLPKYWTGFDVAINVLGYVPLGGLLALVGLRTGMSRGAVWALPLLAVLLSLVLESVQSYLPTRVASKEDWLLNSGGAYAGAVLAWGLARHGWVQRWSRWRAVWLVEESRGGLALLATWPLALLFPAAVPLGLGQVLGRLEDAVFLLLVDTPFWYWLPVSNPATEPLVPGVEMLCVALGLLAPCLVAYCVVHTPRWRLVVSLALALLGLWVTALSAALSWGPGHAWAWLGLPCKMGLLLALLCALALVRVPWRWCAALALLALGWSLALLNQAPESPYFAHTLQGWEQGRFIRFYGLAQWLGWLWPYAAGAYVLTLLATAPQPSKITP